MFCPMYHRYVAIAAQMIAYAQHIKAEVTTGLSETEMPSLLKRAADIAKAETLQAIINLRADGPENETARLSAAILE